MNVRHTIQIILLFFTLGFFAAASAGPREDAESGLTAFQKGDLEAAVELWTKAAKGYEEARNTRAAVLTLTQLAHAYQLLGQYQKAALSLTAAENLVQRSKDVPSSAVFAAGAGNFYLATGEWEKAEAKLKEALRLGRETGNPALVASVQNNLGNLAVAQRIDADAPEATEKQRKQYAAAQQAYLESATLAKEAKNNGLAAKALLNAAMAANLAGEHTTAEQHLTSGLEQSRGLSASYDKVYALLNAGLVHDELGRRRPTEFARHLKSAGQVLNEALNTAAALGDQRAESYALGYLGKLYESERRYDDALTLTRRAIFTAQKANAPESLWRWEWQAGRLLKAQSKNDDAIGAYKRAVATLQNIRQEISAAFFAQRLSYRDSIGPVYLELVDLLLRHPEVLKASDKSQLFLHDARSTVETFKAAELRDYFRDDCVDAALAKDTKADVASPTALIIHPIVLPDRLELLISQAGKLNKFTVPVTAEKLTEEVNKLRFYLRKRQTEEYLEHAQTVYNWVVRPLEPELKGRSIDTLVFVPDGALRTVPMAALHDGKQFLIEKYPVAVTPGLDLSDPKPLRREKVNVFAAGLSEAVQGFDALPNVPRELASIQRIYGGAPLINKEYVMSRVEKELQENRFNVVHIASHGVFSGDIDKTYLLTFDDKLSKDRLDKYIGMFRYRDDPLELLTLSACETAEGDERAALGLAGIAVKAGARSALATLWSISDDATATLIEEFYQQLKDPSVSRAAALQRAQLKLLRDASLLEGHLYVHPTLWSPFLLINNWL